ncbi:MAG: winged helix-turn-helix domain-containing protein [Fervidicoccaceae archaeon]
MGARSGELPLSSRGKAKILRVLYSLGEVNITRIVRETRLNHRAVSRHLREMTEAGLVIERTLGRSKLYSLNYADPRVLALRDALEALEEVGWT